MHARAGGFVIGAGGHMCVLWTKKNLNRTLAIDFQTFVVGFLIEFID